MPKVKDIVLGILVSPLLLSVMMYASYEQYKEIRKKSKEEPKKEEDEQA